MARNYYEFFVSRVLLGGNYTVFIRGEQEEAQQAATDFINSFGGTLDWDGLRGYVLINKQNMIDILTLLSTHYSSFGIGSYTFFQDGFRALESPRETWSNGE